VIGALEANFLLGLAVSFLFAGSLIDAFGPKSAYVLAGAGCFACALMLVPLVRGKGAASTQGVGPASTPEVDATHRMAEGSVTSARSPGS
jgi:MFS family permease